MAVNSVIVARVTGIRAERTTGKSICIGCVLTYWAIDAYATFIHIVIYRAGHTARAIAGTATRVAVQDTIGYRFSSLVRDLTLRASHALI